MKKFFILSALLCLGTLQTFACYFKPVTNYYIFRSETNTATDGGLTDRMMASWEEYAGKDVTYDVYQLGSIAPSGFTMNDNAIIATARERNDKEMLAYLQLLNKQGRCNNIMGRMNDKWDYPTKAEISFAQNGLRSVQKQALAYKGKRLRDRYLLMAMRTAFMLKSYPQATNLWLRLSKEPASIYRDLGENLYAGILLRQGKRQQALDIYAKQGDWMSLKWAVRRERNVAGMRKIYATTPNSPLLRYLVQDFVNNVQETCDNRDDLTLYTAKELQSQFNAIGRAVIYDNEVKAFMAFADEVVKNSKVDDPAMWQSATALIDYYYHRNTSALARIQKALTLKGCEVSQETARLILLFISTAEASPTKEYQSYLKGELEWIQKNLSKGDEHFSNLYTRLVKQELDSLFMRWQRPDLSLYLLTRYEMDYDANYLSEKKKDWTQEPLNFYGSFMQRMENLPTEEVIKFYNGLHQSSPDDFTKWLKKTAYHNEDFYNDYIGTRLLADGAFEKAQPYLERVSLNYLSKQGIAFYAAQRTYKKEAWIDPQWSRGDEWADTTITFKRNQKVDFCRDMIATKRAYETASAGERAELAYQLANLYFQASPKGRCWYLTSYSYSGYSDYEFVEENSKEGFRKEGFKKVFIHHPFIEKAKALLEEAALTRNFLLKEKALFALAYLPQDPPLMEQGEWYEETNFAEVVNRNSPQWEAFGRLAMLGTEHTHSQYVSACGIYRAYLRIAK